MSSSNFNKISKFLKTSLKKKKEIKYNLNELLIINSKNSIIINFKLYFLNTFSSKFKQNNYSSSLRSLNWINIINGFSKCLKFKKLDWIYNNYSSYKTKTKHSKLKIIKSFYVFFFVNTINKIRLNKMILSLYSYFKFIKLIKKDFYASITVNQLNSSDLFISLIINGNMINHISLAEIKKRYIQNSLTLNKRRVNYFKKLFYSFFGQTWEFIIHSTYSLNTIIINFKKCNSITIWNFVKVIKKGLFNFKKKKNKLLNKLKGALNNWNKLIFKKNLVIFDLKRKHLSFLKSNIVTRHFYKYYMCFIKYFYSIRKEKTIIDDRFFIKICNSYNYVLLIKKNDWLNINNLNKFFNKKNKILKNKRLVTYITKKKNNRKKKSNRFFNRKPNYKYLINWLVNYNKALKLTRINFFYFYIFNKAYNGCKKKKNYRYA